MEKAVEQGKVRSIDISNFDECLDDLLNNCKIEPAVIQVECHPFWNQDNLRKKSKNMELSLKVGIQLDMEIKV